MKYIKISPVIAHSITYGNQFKGGEILLSHYLIRVSPELKFVGITSFELNSSEFFFYCSLVEMKWQTFMQGGT